MKKLVLLGTGGFAREAAWLVERINNIKPTWDLIGFTDVNVDIHGAEVNGYPVLGSDDWLKNRTKEVYAVCCAANPLLRKKIINSLPAGVKFATLIDPTVELSKYNRIGKGVVICCGTSITVNITIGSHVIINLNCTVGHDTILKDYCTLNPNVNISGNNLLEEGITMGTGSKTIQGVKIGKNAIVGAGAVVVKDLPEECTAVGVPAKPIRY